MRETDDIERMFRESFETFEVAPPASVKTVIDKELKSKNRILWWLPALAIMLVTIASSLVYFNRDFSSQTPAKNKFSVKNTVSQKENSSFVHPNNSAVYSGKSISKEKKEPAQSSVKRAKENESDKVREWTNSTANSRSKPTFKAKSSFKNPKRQYINKSPGKNTSITENVSKNTPPNGLTEQHSNGSETQTVSRISSIEPKSANETKNDSIFSAAIDSAIVQDSTVLVNSLRQDSFQNPDENDPPKSGDKKWLASYYFGPQFDLWNIPKNTFDLSIKPSFRTSVELSRKWKDYHLSAGLGYNQLEETSHAAYIVSVDSTLVTVDTFTYYVWDTTKGYSTYNNNSTVFYVPVFIGRTFNLSDNWVVMTDLGATLNFYNTKQSTSGPNSPVKSYNSFGINAALRLYGGYKFNNWMITAGFTYSIYLKTPVVYNGTNGQRMLWSPQLGLHYSF